MLPTMQLQQMAAFQSRLTSTAGGKNSNETFGDLYHVLSIAFLLMEEERETFQRQLVEVEDYFVKRSKHAALLSLNTLGGKLLYRVVSIAFRTWIHYCRAKEVRLTVFLLACS